MSGGDTRLSIQLERLAGGAFYTSEIDFNGTHFDSNYRVFMHIYIFVSIC